MLIRFESYNQGYKDGYKDGCNAMQHQMDEIIARNYQLQDENHKLHVQASQQLCSDLNLVKERDSDE